VVPVDGVFASALEVNVIFGAFIAGIALGAMQTTGFEEAKSQILVFATGFFIPLYFAIVGLRIDLVGSFDAVLFLGFLAFSTVIEGICVYGAMRLIRCSPLDSWHFSVAMNTRGGPGIVLASVALDYGLIDDRLFITLVMVAIATSLVSGVWFRYVVARGMPLLGDAAPHRHRT
jgi:Kef-type K+ transport system membrane component KefB